MIRLTEESTFDDVLAALNEKDPHPWNGDEAEEKQVTFVTYDGDAYATVRDDIRTTFDVWVISWKRKSFYLNDYMHLQYAVIDKTTGSLYGGEGQAYFDRYVAKIKSSSDLDAVIEVLKRGCNPTFVGTEEL